MSMYKFETTYGLTYDKVIERMKNLIDHEKFIRCDFDYAQYHWVIGGAVVAVMRKNFKQNPTSILGINVEVVDWNPRNISSIFLNINDSEPKPHRVNYSVMRTIADCTDKHTIGRVEIVPKKVIFNDPATIVFWCDGSKTVVKAKDEMFDPEKGLAMAYAKKASGNKGSYYNEFKKWIPKEEKEEAEANPKLCCECKYWKLAAVAEPCRSCIIAGTSPNWVKADE